jgi:hypothetical protein
LLPVGGVDLVNCGFCLLCFPISINLGVAGVDWSLLAFLVKVNYYFKTMELFSKCTTEIFGYVVYLDIQKKKSCYWLEGYGRIMVGLDSTT